MIAAGELNTVLYLLLNRAEISFFSVNFAILRATCPLHYTHRNSVKCKDVPKIISFPPHHFGTE
jgi:hypothetical protein